MGWVDPWVGSGRGSEMADLQKIDVSRLLAEKVESVQLIHWGLHAGLI